MICGIVFLPLVLDSTASGRNELINKLKDIQKALNQRSLDTQLVWLGAQTQPDLEKVFGVDANYPSLFIISSTKDVFKK